jgi:hypothetical protein
MTASRKLFGRFERARYEVHRDWPAYLVVSVLLAGLVAALFLKDRFLHAKGEPTAAQIVSLNPTDGTRNHVWGAPVTVVARSKDGLVGEKTVSFEQVAGCKAGDPVSAVRVGAALRIERLPCAAGRP